MSEQAILRDCLETLKHASLCYLRANHEADSERLRDTFAALAVDKSEAKNAVFNLMHQAVMYPTRPADPEQVNELRGEFDQILDRIGRGQAVPRERNGPPHNSVR